MKSVMTLYARLVPKNTIGLMIIAIIATGVLSISLTILVINVKSKDIEKPLNYTNSESTKNKTTFADNEGYANKVTKTGTATSRNSDASSTTKPAQQAPASNDPSKPEASTTTTHTVTKTPTYLETCIMADGPNNGKYCPFSPPASWSTDYIKYTCRNIIHNSLVPCPSYREFTMIDEQAYSTDSRGLCQFRIEAKNIYREIVVNKPYGNGYPNCLTATPI